MWPFDYFKRKPKTTDNSGWAGTESFRITSYVPPFPKESVGVARLKQIIEEKKDSRGNTNKATYYQSYPSYTEDISLAQAALVINSALDSSAPAETPKFEGFSSGGDSGGAGASDTWSSSDSVPDSTPSQSSDSSSSSSYDSGSSSSYDSGSSSSGDSGSSW